MPASAAATGHVEAHYTAPFSPGALRGKRFGLVRALMGYHADVDALTQAAVARMREAARLIEDVLRAGLAHVRVGVTEIELVAEHAPGSRMAFMHPVKSRRAISTTM